MNTSSHVIRVATYNIHKGVQGLGPVRRLEIHNLTLAVEAFDADVVCLQEVRLHNHREAKHFPLWPELGQADFLAPQGYEAVYRTNAITRHGEHGNALLSRWPVLAHQHEDISDHRLEQRGLLHVTLEVYNRQVHVVVVHLGLVKASRGRQISQLKRFISREVPHDAALLVAGDFNDWGTSVQLALAEVNLHAWGAKQPTYPARLPLAQLDYVFARGLQPTSLTVPHGRAWSRMSDHLPLLAEFSFEK